MVSRLKEAVCRICDARTVSYGRSLPLDGPRSTTADAAAPSCHAPDIGAANVRGHASFESVAPASSSASPQWLGPSMTFRAERQRELLTRCPGCGDRVRWQPNEAAVHRCPRCETPWRLSLRDLDVEYAVHERLYGQRRELDEIESVRARRPQIPIGGADRSVAIQQLQIRMSDPTLGRPPRGPQRVSRARTSLVLSRSGVTRPPGRHSTTNRGTSHD